LLFHQLKYGLDKPAYAAIGGLFEIGETPHECASRELLEETGLVSEELVDLGRYRVQVNRGGGYLYAYLARNCVRAPNGKPSDDYEKQEKRLLSKRELIEVVLQGKVGEAQWVATLALGLLHEEFGN
jgi:ADP-ribose pyrophosphatase